MQRFLGSRPLIWGRPKKIISSVHDGLRQGACWRARQIKNDHCEERLWHRQVLLWPDLRNAQHTLKKRSVTQSSLWMLISDFPTSAIFLAGYQPPTPALMHCCSLSTPPRKSWERDFSRPSLMPKGLGCCDEAAKLSEPKKGVLRKWIGKCSGEKYCNNPVPNQTTAVHCWPFTLHMH